ncbi:MAG: ATP-dependent DNA ligase [Propionicimonas sp.]|uniref:ATP-dependent DNA ligase n=1 Tax=Propionicimonas sp. TaxID=1955623 RepID=UPI003D0AB1AE
MSLPLRPPLEPMLARSQATIPPGMAYEPKWDGFRCLVFRENDDVALISRNGRDLSIYFPEVVQAVQESTPPRCVLDGELVVVNGDRLDFVRLTERIHPAQKRIDLLSATTPASLVFWDLLALDDTDLTALPFTERRTLLERALAHSEPPIHLTPITTDVEVAKVWFTRFEGAGLDGVVAKPLDGRYEPGKRTMVKIKHAREADVVVAGWREHKNSTPERPLLGSLQLGLYDEAGALHFVGVAAAFPEARRAELAAEFGPVTLPPGSSDHPWSSFEVEGRRPGAVSRWSAEIRQTNLIWPMLVAEVGYEHMEGTRFRHTAQFRRWRPDREPASCTFAQLEEVVGYDLAEVLAGTA